MAFATQEDVFGEVELLFGTLVSSLSTKKAPTPFPRLSYADAMARYGTDKPDLRFGLEIVDVTEELGGRTELPMFAEARRGATSSGRCWPGGGRSGPGAGSTPSARRPRASGTIGSWLQLPADWSEVERPAVPQAHRRRKWAHLVAAVGASPGDAVLTCVGPPPSASTALGQVRSALGATSAWPTPTCSPFAG